jgi:hypothetical protein
MNQLVLFLAVGMLLLALLLFWGLRTRASGVNDRALSDAEQTLADLELEPPPRALAERIFASQDWDFVCSQAPLQTQRMFLKERGALALTWLRQTRKRATRLMDFHRRAVRRSTNLRPGVEVRLAANYVLFIIVCEILLGLIWLRGPFHARRMASYAIRVAEGLWLASGQLLAELDPACLKGIEAVCTKRSAPS